MIWKNSFWNLLGVAVPLLISLITMGWLARELGAEKFGVFLIAFSVIGYASVFDAGLTRAVIRFIAFNNRDYNADRVVMGTAIVTIFFLGLIGSFLIFLFSESIVGYLNVEESSYNDVVKSFDILSLIILPTLLSMVLFALPEGRQDFFKLSIYKAVSGGVIAVAPLIAVLYEMSLASAMVGLLAGRVFSFLIALIPSFLVFRFDFLCFRMKTLKDLFNFGGWITLSNIISPVMVNSDRLILSNYLGASQVAFYAAPSEIIGRMSVVPASIARVLFPLFSSSNKESSEHSRNAYFGMILILLTMIVPVFILSGWVLTLWLGKSFSGDASLILKILLVGFFFNALAQIPFAQIQAYGKSRVTAVIHLIELIPYLIILFYLVKNYGLVGAAIAWSIRVISDYIILAWCAARLSRIAC